MFLFGKTHKKWNVRLIIGKRYASIADDEKVVFLGGVNITIIIAWIFRSNVGAFWYGVHENDHGIFLASIAEWGQSHSTPFWPTQTHPKTIASSLESPS